MIDRAHSFATQAGEHRLPALVLAAGESGASGGKAGLRTLSLPLWRSERLALPFASRLTVVPSVQPDATLRVLATSSSTAEVETARVSDLSPTRDWGPAREPREVNLIASSEGKLTSAFGKEEAARPARVLAIASAGVWTVRRRRMDELRAFLGRSSGASSSAACRPRALAEVTASELSAEVEPADPRQMRSDPGSARRMVTWKPMGSRVSWRSSGAPSKR